MKFGIHSLLFTETYGPTTALTTNSNRDRLGSFVVNDSVCSNGPGCVGARTSTGTLAVWPVGTIKGSGAACPQQEAPS